MMLLPEPDFHPKLLLSNVQSLWPKIDEFRLIMSTLLPDIACLTETWLTSDIDSDFIKVDGFHCARADRRHKRGGGTAIYVRDGIQFCSKEISEAFNHEAEGIVLELSSAKIFVLCIYVPPSLSSASLEAIRDKVVDIVDEHLTAHRIDKTIIVGDFNHFRVDRLSSDLDLIDIVQHQTRGNNILDHILINRDLSAVYKPGDVVYDPPIGKSDHKTLVATPSNHSNQRKNSQLKVVYDFRDSNMRDLLQKAYNTNWEETQHTEDVSAMWRMFHSKLRLLLESSIPQKTVLMNSKDKSWITPLTKVLINEKWAAFRRKDWAQFNHLKMKVRREVIKAKEIWATKLKKSNYGIWKLTKYLSGKSGSKEQNFFPTIKNSSVNLAEMFANAMSENVVSKLQEDFLPSDSDLWTIKVSRHDTAARLKKLPKNKAPGSDGIPNRIYAFLADVIASPLTAIFNRSLSDCTLPTDWKEGIVVPIPKTNPPDANKVRMITLLPTPSKILERIVLDSVRAQLEPLFGNRQHAFRRNCSTTTALLQIVDKATEVYDCLDYSACAIMSFDLSKAFDKVDHHILLNKLKGHDLPTPFIRWIRGYLTDRSFRVKVQGTFSERRRIQVGVPQGSVLGPALFCVMVGDFACMNTNSSLTQYADDLTIVTGFKTSDSSHIRDIISEEIQNFTSWCEQNKQQHNQDKSQLLIFSRGRKMTFDQPLSICVRDSIKILGVHLNSSLTWHDHVNEICKKASRRLRILRVLRPLTSSEELHQVYSTVVRSIFDYASALFVGLGTGLSKKLQRIDRRAHRIIFHENKRSCTCGDDCLSKRRETLSMVLFSKIILTDDHILRDCLPRTLQHSDRLSNFFCRTERRQRSFFPHLTLLWNRPET